MRALEIFQRRSKEAREIIQSRGKRALEIFQRRGMRAPIRSCMVVGNLISYQRTSSCDGVCTRHMLQFSNDFQTVEGGVY